MVFHLSDLPGERADWDPIFLRAMGSPDANGRQLDGMGGGISSLSKVCVVGPASTEQADVDYTFAQVQVDTAVVDFAGNCGNMSSAIGPFAVDEGLVHAADGPTTVRIHNTNTGKIIASTFDVSGGRAVTDGDYAIDGVSGTGAPVRLDFLDPGGSATGRLLPSGQGLDRLDTEHGAFQVSMVDAANPCVFVPASSLGWSGTELPEVLESNLDLLHTLESIRQTASVAMGISTDREAAAGNRLTPFVALVAEPQDYRTLSGRDISADEVDVVVRFLSSGRPHRAVPVTGAMCTAIAARVPGSTVQDAARQSLGDSAPLRLGTPSGILDVNSSVSVEEGKAPHAEFASTYRTTRRLFDGNVYF
ncbi:2-methylaconitate cis-trans isomerase PrpF family protein [Citricoccus parietis]|uniref:2-methylaconitate cis-trans isomerase PrpF family protein n=1 Tax=Citricoccus parietis TaxID=592307 RepID=A0ABV5G3F0_9MICC